LKIPAAYFRGQWFIEAPRNSEGRLAQLRGEQPTPRNDKTNIPATPRNDKANIQPWEDEEFWGPIEREASSYDSPTDSEQKATLKLTEHAQRPHPIDYGLTRDDLNLYSDSRTIRWFKVVNGETVQCLGPRIGEGYKKGRRWFAFFIPRDWRDRERRAYTAGGGAVWLLLFGALAVGNSNSSSDSLLGLGLMGGALMCLLYAI